MWSAREARGGRFAALSMTIVLDKSRRCAGVVQTVHVEASVPRACPLRFPAKMTNGVRKRLSSNQLQRDRVGQVVYLRADPLGCRFRGGAMGRNSMRMFQGAGSAGPAVGGYPARSQIYHVTPHATLCAVVLERRWVDMKRTWCRMLQDGANRAAWGSAPRGGRNA